jgi:type IV secretory pathway TraG/TraD family ATPase VirD4
MQNFDPYTVSYFAKTNFRNSNQIFGIKQSDRLFHFYCVGKSGAGKTSLLLTLAKEDIQSGRGLTFLDVHGDASVELFNYCNEYMRDRHVLYLDTTNPNIHYGYNPLRSVSKSKQSLVVSNILEIFQRNWKSAWGMKMEHILRMILLTLIDQPKSDLADILRLIHDNDFRKECQRNSSSETIHLFWEKEFKKYKSTDLLPILNKIGALLSHSIVRKILVENKEMISLREIMDSNGILIINVSKGAIGSDASNILGGLFLTSLASSAFSRIDTLEEDRVPHFLYVDEFQVLSGNELIGELLAQSRKFKLALILSNQFLHQLPIEVKNAVLGNVGTLVCFRLGINDARLMEKEFYPEFSASDFTSLPNYSIYLKLMIDGKPSKPFSADTIL